MHPHFARWNVIIIIIIIIMVTIIMIMVIIISKRLLCEEECHHHHQAEGSTQERGRGEKNKRGCCSYLEENGQFSLNAFNKFTSLHKIIIIIIIIITNQ